MRRNKLFPGILVVFMLSLPVKGQVEFIEVLNKEDMDLAMKKADDGMLLLFVDVYATWCGPCKMMDRDVYTNATVAQYMNTHFVNVRMDGESDYGRIYAANHGLQGYPTMFIFSDEGEYLTSLVGFNPVEDLLMKLKGVVDSYTRVKGYRADYEQGRISIEDFADYISLVREMGNEEKAQELAGVYIRQEMGETLASGGQLSDYDIRAVAYFTDLTDPWWPRFVTQDERVQMVLGAEYIPVLEKIYNNSLVKAVDGRDIALISRIANELSPLVEAASDHARDIRSLPFIQYYYYTNQNGELIAYVDSRFNADRKGDHQWLFETASQIIDMDQQYQTREIMEKGEQWFKACISMAEKYDYYFYYGMTLLFQQKKEEAREAFDRARALAVSPDQVSMVDRVMEYLESR